MEFCLATVLTLIKESLFDSISDEELFNMLILDIVVKLNLNTKNGESYYLEKEKVSKLMNNKMNVPGILRKSLSKEETSVVNIKKYFLKALIPKLIPEKIDSLCVGLIKCYSDYEDSSDSILLELKACYNEQNPARLLAYIFRLSLMTPNKFNRKAIEKEMPAASIDRRQRIKNVEIPAENNIRCLRAVLEAYNSAEGNIKEMQIEDYPQYKNHFLRQKEAFFTAEAVRHASRDSFLDEEDPFEDLLDESYDGIIETWDKKYKDGLERMETVLSQAVQISLESNLISRETAWVTVKVKKGLCHILVNEGRIEGWIYDESL